MKENSDTELVSVIMAVYKENKEILSLAIESILNQTYTNIEFVIILDNPGGKEQIECIQKYSDKRIKLFINEKNIGLVKSLNKGLELATGRYIARMDADDISIVERIEKQIAFLKKYNYDLCGSHIQNFYDNENQKVWRCPINPNSIKKVLRFQTAIGHPAWFGKREVFDTLEGYREIFACEDYDFLLRATQKGFLLSNVPEILLKYRLNPMSISRTNSGKQELIKRFLAKNYRKNKIVKLSELEEYVNSNKYKRNLEKTIKYTKIKEERNRNISNKFNYYINTFKMFLFIKDVIVDIKNKIYYKYIIVCDKECKA